jgi:type I site-specific restriction endonuclease
MGKKSLTERDICTKLITPALVDVAVWDLHTQLREEVHLTDGRVVARGQRVTRGKSRRADHVLYHPPNLPLAVQVRIVAKVAQPMARCDDRETKLRQAKEPYEKIVEAAVRYFVGQTPKPAPATARRTPGRVGTAPRPQPGIETERVGGAHPPPAP